MTDSHAHLTFEQITSNLDKILDEFVDQGGKHILNVGYTPESNNLAISQYYELKNRYPNVVQVSLGIHPEYIMEMLTEGIKKYKQIEKIADALNELVTQHKDIISAIGECGLDYYQIKARPEIPVQIREEIIEQQKYIFKRQIEIALKNKLPLTIHTRDEQGSNQCVEDTLKIVSDIGKGQVTGSFHSYTQDHHYIPQIISLGFHVGVNGIATYPKAQNVRDLIKQIPLEKLLLETDSPLLPPQNVRKNRKMWRSFGTPADIDEIAQTVSEALGIPREKILEQTTNNYQSLFLIN